MFAGIYTIYNPINIDQFLSYSENQIRQRLHIENNTSVVGIIGRLTKQKGHQFLFKAFQKILKIRPDTILLVVGDGELRKTLVEQADNLHIDTNIIFVGDSGVDMQTAARANMYPVGVLWGFREADELLANGAKHLIKHPMEFFSIF